MIKKFIDRLLGAAGNAKKQAKFGTRREIGPQEHGIDASLVDAKRGARRSRAASAAAPAAVST